MSKLSEKFAAGKKSLSERQAAASVNCTPAPLYQRSAGPLHGSVTTMKIDLLKSEIESLKAGKLVLSIPPGEIRSSAWSNRHEDSFSGLEFKAFTAEIDSAGGNIQPIKVRRLLSDEPYKYELVFGHRRHRSCLALGIDVIAIVEDIDEKTLFIEMDRENRLRADLTPYEQGLNYAKVLDSGLFASLRKLADELGADASNVSKAVALARLPELVLDAFESRLDIQYRWAFEIRTSLEKDPELILARAADIKRLRMDGNILSSQAAFNLLVGKDAASSKFPSRKISVGKHVLTVTERGKKVVFEVNALGREKHTRIEKFIASVMAE